MVRFSVFLEGEQQLTLELESGREYFAGRNEENEIHLSEFPGISRKHFRIAEENGVWVVEVLSKFGELSRLGSKVSRIEINAPLSFSLGPYEFHVTLEENRPVEHQPAEHEPESEPQTNSGPPEPTYAGSRDATQVGRLEMQAYVRIVEGRSQSQIKLVGNLWTAGRDPSCEIVLQDQHSSRKQFSIALTQQGYTIIDLGSSNGTLLNNSALPAHQPVPLRSGDVITVLSTQIHFELRNLDFDRKIAAIQQSVQDYDEEIVETPYMLEAPLYSQDYHPPAAYEYSQDQVYQQPHEQLALPAPAGFDFKKHFVKILIAGLLVGGGIFYLMPDSKPSKPESAKADPFSKLTPEQQQAVKDSYELSKQLVGHRKWEMALAELAKVHQLLPAYQDSKALESQAQRAVELRNEQAEFERAQQEQQEMQRKVLQIVEGCKAQMTRQMLPPQIQSCLGPALELDPGNEMAAQLITQAEMNLLEQERKEQAKESFAKKVRSLERICSQPVALEKSGQLYKARQAYQVCIASALPDPEGLKERARKSLTVLNQTMEQRLRTLLSEAQSAYAKPDFKTAFDLLAKARLIDPESAERQALFTKIDRDVTNRMKILYSDAALEESMGQIESAKEKWLKIININLAESLYYKRAKAKLQRYGVM